MGEKAAATGGGRGLRFLLSSDFVGTKLRMPQFLSPVPLCLPFGGQEGGMVANRDAEPRLPAS